MNPATWLQDRRIQKFRDVLSRWAAGELSMVEAGGVAGYVGAPVPALSESLRGGGGGRAARSPARLAFTQAGSGGGGFADAGTLSERL
jgi:hypothetical protein